MTKNMLYYVVYSILLLIKIESEDIIMRASGVLMPVSSLPSKYGIGCFSKEAFEFVDTLVKAGQSKWQVLPFQLLRVILIL